MWSLVGADFGSLRLSTNATTDFHRPFNDEVFPF